MAIDTENKRRSVHGYGIKTVYPVSDGTIDLADRRAVAWLYASDEAPSPPPPPPLPIPLPPPPIIFVGGQGSYILNLRDHDGRIVAQFAGGGRGKEGGDLQSFSYRKRLRTPGASTVRIFGNDGRINQYLVLPDNLDFQWEFRRRDALFQDTHEKDFETFHRGQQFDMEQSGRLIYVSYGQGFNVLLTSEPIRYPTGSSGALKSGDVAVVTRAYVDENIGPNAGLDDLGLSRVRQALEVPTGALTGINWEGDRANELLSDVLNELADYQRAGDYMILGTNPGRGPASFEFIFRPVRWGADKTKGNTAGNVPVIFRPLANNVTEVSTNYSFLDELNAIYVLGQGPGSLQKIRTRADNTRLDYSPWNRRAVARKVSSSNNTELDTAGDGVIAGQRPIMRISFAVQQTRATRYIRDWDMGDLVTVEFRGQDVDVKVVGVTVGVTSDGKETITPEMETEVEV